jgi:heptosyltransferase I
MNSFHQAPSPLHARSGRRICIVMLTAVGDAVHVLPVVNAIRRQEPEAHITWVLQPGPAALVRGHPAVDELVVFERKHGWRAFLDVRAQLRARPFDLVLALQSYLKAGVITAIARAPVKVGYDRRRARDANTWFTTEQIAAGPPSHIQDEYLEFLRHLAMTAEPVEWGLGPWGTEAHYAAEVAKRIGEPYAAMVIGSSKPDKDWQAERWAAVCDALASDYGLRPVLVGGRSPREVETESRIRAQVKQPVISWLDSGLRRLVTILHSSSLVISLDTGPLHMAVALDRPVISLLGYSNPLRTGPYRRFHDLIINAYGDTTRNGQLARDTRRGRMEQISVDDVLGKVRLWDERYGR